MQTGFPRFYIGLLSVVCCLSSDPASSDLRQLRHSHISEKALSRYSVQVQFDVLLGGFSLLLHLVADFFDSSNSFEKLFDSVVNLSLPLAFFLFLKLFDSSFLLVFFLLRVLQVPDMAFFTTTVFTDISHFFFPLFELGEELINVLDLISWFFEPHDAHIEHDFVLESFCHQVGDLAAGISKLFVFELSHLSLASPLLLDSSFKHSSTHPSKLLLLFFRND